MAYMDTQHETEEHPRYADWARCKKCGAINPGFQGGCPGRIKGDTLRPEAPNTNESGGEK